MAMKAEEVFGILNPKVKKGAQFDPDDYYTKNQIDQKLEDTYKIRGSIFFSELPPALSALQGDTYNIKDTFTTTSDFLEGAGFSYPPGTNVYMTMSGKWDCMAGTYDFSDFVMKSDLTSMTKAEIEAICTIE
jgi:hypothetical protein